MAINKSSKINRGQRTALIRAAALGRLKEVQEILEKSPLTLNEQTESGETALLVAVKNGHQNVVHFLTEVPGIDLTIQDQDGLSALDCANLNNNRALNKLLSISQTQIVTQLIQYLKIKASKTFEQYDEDDLMELIHGLWLGQCNGLTGVWLYRSLLGEETQFFGHLRLITHWDGCEECLHASENYLGDIFEQILNDSVWMQDAGTFLNLKFQQSDIADLINFVRVPRKGAALRDELRISFHFMPDELMETLGKLLQHNKAIYLGGHDHTMGFKISKREDQFVVAYDSNDEYGEQICNSVEELQGYIVQQLYENFGYSTDILPIQIVVLDKAGNEPAFTGNEAVEWIEAFLKRNDNVDRKVSFEGSHYTTLLSSVWRKDYNLIKLLMKQKDLNINLRDEEGWPALLHAVSKQDYIMVRLLANDPRIDPEDLWSSILYLYTHTLDNHSLIEVLEKALANRESFKKETEESVNWRKLLQAIAKKESSIVNELLNKKNIDLNKKTSLGKTALMIAILANDDKILQLLFQAAQEQSVDLNLTDNTGFTLLMFAISSGRPAMVKLVLDELSKYKTDFNVRDKQGNTAAILAAETFHPTIIDILNMKQDIDFNVFNHVQKSPLMIAIKNGDYPIVMALLDNPRININLQNDSGITALMMAVENNEIDIIDKLLLRKEIDLDLKNKSGETALDWALNEGQEEIVDLFLKHMQVENKVLEDKLKIWQMMIQAESVGQRSMVEFIANQAGINLEDNKIQLLLAAIRGDVDTMEAIIKTGIDANFDYLGYSPLFLAKFFNRTEAVELLKSLPIPALLLSGKLTQMGSESKEVTDKEEVKENVKAEAPEKITKPAKD